VQHVQDGRPLVRLRHQKLPAPARSSDHGSEMCRELRPGPPT
jgi:hypothetical protein